MKKIIYIHGIGQQANAENLKREWDLALFGKAMDGKDPSHQGTSMAYWADLMHDPASQQIENLRAKSMRIVVEQYRVNRAAFRDEAIDYEQIVKDAEVPVRERQEAINFLRKISAQIKLPIEDESIVSFSGMGARAIPLPSFWRQAVAKQLLSWLLPEVAKYFYNEKLREQMRSRLRDLIKSCHQPFVIVSHSLGTVIAFDVLSEDFKRHNCDLFVTMGSPLGIQEVQDVIVKGGGELKVPSGVRAWRNYADRIDLVALDAGLTNDFQPREIQVGSVSKLVTIRDSRILNERTFSIRKFNPHSSIGYLSHSDVQQVVRDEVHFDSSGRFLVARDVIEETVDPDRRVSLLIEVLEPGYAAVDESPHELAKREEHLSTRRKREDRAGKSEKSDAPDLTTLQGRITMVRDEVEQIAISNTLGENPKKADVIRLKKDVAAIRLRKYVAANLTRDEVSVLTEKYKNLCVYAIWKNSSKTALLKRSHLPLKADAGRVSYRATGRGIIWAVLDTGVNWDHPHFKTHGTILEVWDCTTNDDDPVLIGPHQGGSMAGEDGDLHGHGTHVCGIIAGIEKRDEDHEESRKRDSKKAAQKEPEDLISGIAPEAKLIVYKVLDDQGQGNDGWIIKALDHIHRLNESVSRGPKIHGVNLSLGGEYDNSIYGCGYTPICKELRDLWRQGTLVCVAAGNAGQVQVATKSGSLDLNTQLSIGDPANLDDCIAVGSVNADKPHLYGVSWFSSRGPTADGRQKPDVVAPGERIESCSSNFNFTSNHYREESGTSMACPHVSGLLAAFLSVRLEFKGRPDEVKKILKENCIDLGRDRYHQGAGLPNLMAMLTNT